MCTNEQVPALKLTSKGVENGGYDVQFVITGQGDLATSKGCESSQGFKDDAHRNTTGTGSSGTSQELSMVLNFTFSTFRLNEDASEPDLRIVSTSLHQEVNDSVSGTFSVAHFDVSGSSDASKERRVCDFLSASPSMGGDLTVEGATDSMDEPARVPAISCPTRTHTTMHAVKQ